MYRHRAQEGIHYTQLRPIRQGPFQEWVLRGAAPAEACDGDAKDCSNAALTPDDQGATGVVEMLFCTSLVALVGAPDTQPSNSPRKLQIVNTKVSWDSGAADTSDNPPSASSSSPRQCSPSR